MIGQRKCHKSMFATLLFFVVGRALGCLNSS
jgi:hypothetical protein